MGYAYIVDTIGRWVHSETVNRVRVKPVQASLNFKRTAIINLIRIRICNSGIFMRSMLD